MKEQKFIYGSAEEKAGSKPGAKNPIFQLDESQAIRAWGEMANGGDAIAQLCLASALINSKDAAHRKLAMDSVHRAAALGHPEAKRIARGTFLTQDKIAKRLNKRPLNFDPKHYIALIRTLAVDGSANAAYALFAELTDFGKQLDNSEAQQWLRTAASGGHSEAQYLLGYSLFTGKHATLNRDEGVKWLMNAADGKHIAASALLGTLLMDGSIERNIPLAEKYLAFAAQRGSEVAMTNMAALSIDGLRPEKFPGEADQWLRDAADKGFVPALVGIGKRLLRSELEVERAEGVIKLQAAVYAGSVDARYHLGVNKLDAHTYEEKRDGVRLLEEAAAEGDARSLRALGFAYLEGTGIERNLQLGLKLLEQAAEKGDSIALFNIGVAFFQGIGVKTDRSKAIALFEKAADLGCHEAREALFEVRPSEGGENVL